MNADASVVAITAAIGAAGAGGHATTDLDSEVEAFARNATLTASGNLFIDADSTHTARANTFGLGAAIGFAVSAMISDASIGGATCAFADGATTVNVNSAAQITADSTGLRPARCHVHLGRADQRRRRRGRCRRRSRDRGLRRHSRRDHARRPNDPVAGHRRPHHRGDLHYTANASPLGISFGLAGAAPR